jgi:hypothetical protein
MLDRSVLDRPTGVTDRLFAVLLAVVVVNTFLFAAAPALAAVPCIGAPVEDTTVYAEPRVFLEAQGWWGERAADGSVPRYGRAEHLHVAMCFPLQQPVSGYVTLAVRVAGHNLPAGSIITSTRLHDANGKVFAILRWDTVVTQPDVTQWRTVRINSALVPSGWREFRILTTVSRPDNAEIHTSSGWCWENRNGGTRQDASTCLPSGSSVRRTEGRGWYDCFEYKVARTQDWTYPYQGIPAGQNYPIEVALRDGSGTNSLVTGYDVRLNPNFHQGEAGYLVASGTAATSSRSAIIPGSRLGSGLHKLALLTFARGTCTSGTGLTPQAGEATGVLVIPIRVN